MLAHAPIAELNHSNNSTFIKSNSAKPSSDQYGDSSMHSGTLWPVLSSSKAYVQSKTVQLHNTVSSSYANHTASFSKQTYISKIGIYDENRNLIAVAKLATPVKKTHERDLTFKLKLDI